MYTARNKQLRVVTQVTQQQLSTLIVKEQNQHYVAMATSHLTTVMRTCYKESPPATRMLNLFKRYICQTVLNN